MAKPSGSRVSPVLLVVLAAAMATGAAASILVSATSGPPPSSNTGNEVYLPLWVFFVGVFAIFAFVLIVWVVSRLSDPSKGTSNRALMNGLIAILVISLVVVGLRVFAFGGPPAPVSACGTSCTPTNTTTPTSSGSANTTNVSGVGAYDLFPTVPDWVPFVVLGFVVLILVTVAVPQTRRYLSERGDRLTPPHTTGAEPTGVRSALHRASAELDLGADPRTVVLGLYAEMLFHLRPMVGSVETVTPEEIRTSHLVRLGVRPEAARTLTRLFEEARYSTHAMGPEASATARRAVHETLEDLDRRARPA